MKDMNNHNRITALRDKLEKTKAQIREAEMKETELRRKRETKRKIVMGGIFMREISEGNTALEEIFLEGLKKSAPKTQLAFPEYEEQLR